MKLTRPQARALAILAAFPEGVGCNHFAHLMWSDSIGHRVKVRAGHGIAQGKCMWTKAGQFFHALERKGWVGNNAGYASSYSWKWRITKEGRAALKGSEK